MNQRPKILVVATTFPRWENDPVPARFVYDLSRTLADDFAVTVLAPHDPGAALAETLAELSVRRFRYFWPTGKELLADGAGLLPNIRSSALGKIQAPALVAAQYFSLRRLLAHERFDLLHSHWMVPNGLTAAFARRRLPHVLTIHSTDLHLLRQLPGGRQLARAVAGRCDRIFTVSSFLKGMLGDLLGRDAGAQVLPMGVRTDLFRPAAPPPRPPEWRGKRIVLYVGKLIEVKGVRHLLAAFTRLAREQTDLLLLIVGGGNLQTLLEQQARELGIAEAVVFLGPRPHAQVVDYYQWAELVVVPSIVTGKGETEGMPVVILEAMAAGKPVVASCIGSLAEIIRDGDNGFLTPPGEPEGLAAAINRVLRHADLDRLTEAARRTAQQYDWRRIAAVYADCYRKLLKPA